MTSAISGLPQTLQDPYAGSTTDQVNYADSALEASTMSSLLGSLPQAGDSISISAAGLALSAMPTNLDQSVADQATLSQVSGSASVQAAETNPQASLDASVISGLTDPTMPEFGVTSLYQASEISPLMSSMQGQTLALAQTALGGSSSGTLNLSA